MPFDESKHPRVTKGPGGGQFTGLGNQAGSATIKDGLRVKKGGRSGGGKAAGKGKKPAGRKQTLRRGTAGSKQATQLRAARRALVAAGLAKDSASDKQVTAAIKRFQKHLGMKPDGKPNEALLEWLRKNRERKPRPRPTPRATRPTVMRTDDPRHASARLAAPSRTTYRRSALARR